MMEARQSSASAHSGVELCRDVCVLRAGHRVLLVVMPPVIGDLYKTSQHRGDFGQPPERLVQPACSAPCRRSSSARSTALLVSSIARSYARAAATVSPARLSSSACAACSGW
jgi:hypothetical protein